MKHHNIGDVIKMTICGEDGDYIRNIVIFEHKPNIDTAYRYENTDEDWTYHFYRYLDLDSGELKVGRIPYDSTEQFKIEKS